MGTTRLERRLRQVSDEHMDDTAVEIQLTEAAQALGDALREALRDGVVTVPEAKAILASADLVCTLAQESYKRNVLVEQMLTALARELRTKVA